jgi:hypothetical protein
MTGVIKMRKIFYNNFAAFFLHLLSQDSSAAAVARTAVMDWDKKLLKNRINNKTYYNALKS